MDRLPTLEAHGTRIAARWVEFGRLLRRSGLQTTPDQVRDLLRALSLLDMADRDEVYYAARALLCSRREEIPRFDHLFERFWSRGPLPLEAAPLPEPHHDGPEATRSTPPEPVMSTVEQAALAPEEGESGDGPEGVQRGLLYTTQERLRHLDFAAFSDAEMAVARELMSKWSWTPALRRTRRLEPRRHGSKLDLSRTLRRAMSTGGMPFDLRMRGPREKPRPLVLLCDISGSMAPYTRMLLHFLHTLQRGARQTEIFLFGTRLTRITRQLRTRDVERAMRDVGKEVVDWSGGTRTGDTLRAFNTRWARRVLGRGAVVCIISDGWDRGDPALLAAEMAHLQRTSFRLVWLNPLLGHEGYAPLTRGMAAALPFIDNFLPANNLESLRALADLLCSLDLNVRPERRQVPTPSR